jgi:glutamine amidotransferase
MIGIVDYDIGNLRSVQKALQHEGGEAVFVRTPREIAKADGLVLPGVGAFGDCVRSLADSGMWNRARRRRARKDSVFSRAR